MHLSYADGTVGQPQVVSLNLTNSKEFWLHNISLRAHSSRKIEQSLDYLSNIFYCIYQTMLYDSSRLSNNT